MVHSHPHPPGAISRKAPPARRTVPLLRSISLFTWQCSSRDGYPLEPKRGLNGVKPPVEFGQRTRDCCLGHAGKEGPHLAMTGASRGFSQGAVPGWGFSRDRTGSSGSLSCGAREVRSPSTVVVLLVEVLPLGSC